MPGSVDCREMARVHMEGRMKASKYWEARSCGSEHAQGSPGTLGYYRSADAFRYEVEPVISFADFPRQSDARVLEVGTGMGGDLSRFLAAGAKAVGVDLSLAAVVATSARLRLWHQPGTVARTDALLLPFGDDSFDLVWSWGVLHHTGDIERAISEVRRVLKPGGEARLMLYHRPSWVALAAWGRWALLAGKPFQGLARVVAEHIESPGTLALTTGEIKNLMAPFSDVEIRVVGTYWDRKFVPLLGRVAGSKLGWFALVKARKPQTAAATG